jgi:flagellar assembly factor FliW
MEIETRFLGKITVKEEDIIKFPKGIPGFEDLKRFVVLSDGESVFLTLQSVDDADVGFIIIDPSIIVKGYKPFIPQAVQASLGFKRSQKPLVFVIAVIPDDVTKMRVNLKAPVLINPETKLGEQAVLDDRRYPLRSEIYPKLAAVNA